MDNAVIEAQIRQMIVSRLFLRVKPEELRADASLMDVYGVDSVSLLELVVGLEEAFGVRIEDGEFDARNFATVAALREFVRTRLPKS